MECPDPLTFLTIYHIGIKRTMKPNVNTNTQRKRQRQRNIHRGEFRRSSERRFRVFLLENPNNNIRIRHPLVIKLHHRHLPFWVHRQKPIKTSSSPKTITNPFAQTLQNTTKKKKKKKKLLKGCTLSPWLCKIPLGFVREIDEFQLVRDFLLLQS
jgi:hypothetical protein